MTSRSTASPVADRSVSRSFAFGSRASRGRSPDGPDCWLNWAVRERATSRAVGTVQATFSPSGPAAVGELAWVIGTRHQHQGYAKEAAGLIAAWLHEQRL